MARAVALTGSDQLVYTGPGNYRGFAIRETAGATAVVRIYDNTSGSGTLIDTIQLPANGSLSEWYGPDGIYFAVGCYVDVVSGAVEGSIRLG